MHQTGIKVGMLSKEHAKSTRAHGSQIFELHLVFCLVNDNWRFSFF